MKFPNIKVLFIVFASCPFVSLLASCANAQQTASPNIALGKTVSFNKKPNYALCADSDDDKQLTDGKYSSEGNLRNVENTTSIWVQKGTVGWNGVNPVVITIDLGTVQPISGVSYSTAAGRASVAWPQAIYMATSDDNKTWHYAGDLVQLSSQKAPSAAQGYMPFRFVSHNLQTKGRYIAFGVVQNSAASHQKTAPPRLR